MWKTLHGAQHGLMEFSWENLRGFWFGRRTVLAMNQSSGVTGRTEGGRVPCASRVSLFLFSGKCRTKQQLLQAPPRAVLSPIPVILLHPGRGGHNPACASPGLSLQGTNTELRTSQAPVQCPKLTQSTGIQSCSGSLKSDLSHDLFLCYQVLLPFPSWLENSSLKCSHSSWGTNPCVSQPPWDRAGAGAHHILNTPPEQPFQIERISRLALAIPNPSQQ